MHLLIKTQRNCFHGIFCPFPPHISQERSHDHWYCCSVAQSCLTLCSPMDCLQHARPPWPSQSSKVCPSSCPLHWWYHPAISSSDAVFSFCPQSLLASGTFPMSHNRWPKFWSFNFSISPSNEYSVLISLKIDWFDLLAVQRTFRSSKALFCWLSAFFTVQFSQSYGTTGKTIVLIITDLCWQSNVSDFQHTV